MGNHPSLSINLQRNLKAIVRLPHRAPPEEILQQATRYQEIRRRMQLPQQLLMRWNVNFDELLKGLESTLTPEFLNTNNSPATFEFLAHQAFATIFQVQWDRHLGSGKPPNAEQVLWRGQANLDPKSNSSTINHAPEPGGHIRKPSRFRCCNRSNAQVFR